MVPKTAPKTVGRYRREEQIGFGNFGVVYKGVDTVTNRVVAIKSLDLDSVNDEVETVQHEVALLAQLSSAESSNVTKYYGTVLQGSKLWIVMDLCYGGSVRTLLRPGPISEKHLSVLFREICIAVQAIHSQGIIHRDIKAANVLITMSGHVKLCDFGVAAVSNNNAQTKRQTIVGTPYWMAPEVIQEGQSYTNKADIWSLGITFYEMVTGNPPYSDQEAMRAMMLITSSRPPRLEGPKYTPALKDLVALCLDEVPDARPGASELLKHRFIKNYSKTSVATLKTLIDRYSMWKEKHSNQRDSILMFNPHNHDEGAKEDNDDMSLWDFNIDDDDDESDDFHDKKNTNDKGTIRANTNGKEPKAIRKESEHELADAPDSLRELFGMPPKPYDDSPPLPLSYNKSAVELGTKQSSSAVAAASAPIPPASAPGTVVPGRNQSYNPPVSNHALPGQGFGQHAASTTQLDSSTGFAFPPVKPQAHAPSAPGSQVNLAHGQQYSQTPMGSSVFSSHQHNSIQPNTTQPNTPNNTVPFNASASSEPRPQPSRAPTAISIARARSTTVASPSVGSNHNGGGPYAGWKSRHGSEAQLDMLKQPGAIRTNSRHNSDQENTNSLSRQNSMDQSYSMANQSLQLGGSASATTVSSPLGGPANFGSASSSNVGPNGLSLNIQEANKFNTPTSFTSYPTGPTPLSPNSNQLTSPNSSPSPKRSANHSRPTIPPTSSAAAAASAANKSRAALPRLQMPPRNAFKPLPMMSAPAGASKPHIPPPLLTRRQTSTTNPGEFPRLPTIDVSALSDNASDKQSAELLLELLQGYKNGIKCLAESYSEL